MVVLGLDIGTTVVKGAAFDREGRQIAFARREYPLLRPSPGFYELDSLQILEAIREVIREISRSVGPGRIRALASSALGEAVLPVDSRGNPLYNTLVALDHRAVEQARSLARIASQLRVTSSPSGLAAVAGS